MWLWFNVLLGALAVQAAVLVPLWLLIARPGSRRPGRMRPGAVSTPATWPVLLDRSGRRPTRAVAGAGAATGRERWAQRAAPSGLSPARTALAPEGRPVQLTTTPVG